MANNDYSPRYNQSHALVIGINDYQSSPPLEYARNDAVEFAKFLVNEFKFPDKNVKLLLDTDATRENIHSNFLEYADEKSQPDDRLIFFFAGHGLTRTGSRGEAGYLVPCDGNPSKISSLIRWQELTLNSELIPAKHLFFIMDACYGGLAFQRSSSSYGKRVYEEMLSRYSRQCLTAGKADEVVADSGGPRENHSIFTGHLLNALDGAGARDDGVITASSVMSYVYENVGSDYNSEQSPHYGYLDGDGDLIFNPHLISEDLLSEEDDSSEFTAPAKSLKEKITEEADSIIKDKEREGILRSKEGVKVAQDEGNDFVTTTKNLCEDLSRSKAGIVFGFEHKHLGPLQWEIKIRVIGSSAFIKFYIPFTNSTIGIERENFEDAFIRTYFANYDLFDSYRRIKEEDKVIEENYYFFNIDREGNPGWATKKRPTVNDFSTKDLGEKILSDLYNFAKENKK